MKKGRRDIKKRTAIQNDSILIGVFFSFVLAFIIVKAILNSVGFTNEINDYFFLDRKDYFMDFFNPVFFSSKKDPYVFKSLGAMYPPICYLIYRLFLIFIPDSDIVGRFKIRSNQTLIMLLVVAFIVMLVVLLLMLIENIKISKAKKYAACFCIVLSFPFLFLIERANILLLCFILLCFFVFYHDSKNKFLSELSLVMLALAAAIKIYPAVFGVLLFFEDKINYKKIVRCAIYGIIMFFVPFFFFDGFKTINYFVSNLNYGAEATVLDSLSVYKRIDISTFIYDLNNNLDLSIKYKSLQTMSTILVIVFSIASVLLVLMAKEKYKKVLGIVNITLLVPSFVYTYGSVLLIIPLLLWLNEKLKKRNIFDICYGLLITLILAPVPVISNNAKTLYLIMLIYIFVLIEAVKLSVIKIKDIKANIKTAS